MQHSIWCGHRNHFSGKGSLKRRKDVVVPWSPRLLSPSEIGEQRERDLYKEVPELSSVPRGGATYSPLALTRVPALRLSLACCLETLFWGKLETPAWKSAVTILPIRRGVFSLNWPWLFPAFLFFKDVNCLFLAFLFVLRTVLRAFPRSDKFWNPMLPEWWGTGAWSQLGMLKIEDVTGVGVVSATPFSRTMQFLGIVKRWCWLQGFLRAACFLVVFSVSCTLLQYATGLKACT